MRSPHTTGDDDPRPGISTFHLMFCVSLHTVGGSACRDTPVAWGPRHWGQNFSASVLADQPATTDMANSMKTGVPRAGGTLRIRTFYVCGFERSKAPKGWNPGCRERGGGRRRVQLSRGAGQGTRSHGRSEAGERG